MITISASSWNKYFKALSRVNKTASEAMAYYVQEFGIPATEEELADFIYAAFNISTKYGEAASSLAAQYYDTIAEVMGKTLPAAVPAPTATIAEVNDTVRGVLHQSQNEEMVSSAIGRLVKQAGEDTILRNAKRDRALVAWIPNGDTCAFCIALASRGWESASAKLMKNGHAKHVHANCDCTHAVTWDPSNTSYASYDPDRYREIYDSAEGRDSQQKINAMRREFYAENRERINEQRRDAYARRRALESSSAEELDT